jgi:hypothetical protein
VVLVQDTPWEGPGRHGIFLEYGGSRPGRGEATVLKREGVHQLRIDSQLTVVLLQRFQIL